MVIHINSELQSYLDVQYTEHAVVVWIGLLYLVGMNVLSTHNHILFLCELYSDMRCQLEYSKLIYNMLTICFEYNSNPHVS
jgi:hypothetical protein